MIFNTKNIELLKRSLVHFDPRKQQAIGIILKLNELFETYNEFKSAPVLSACDTSPSKVCTDDLLKSIRPVCSAKEREIIDTIINVTKAIEMCNMYKAISEQHTDSPSMNLNNFDLTPEQQSMLDNLDILMQNSRNQNNKEVG